MLMDGKCHMITRRFLAPAIRPMNAQDVADYAAQAVAASADEIRRMRTHAGKTQSGAGLPMRDYLGHADECFDGWIGDSKVGRVAEWGSRATCGAFADVDGYGTREAAEKSIGLTAKYNLPAYELVKRVNGTWCNVW